MYPYVHPLSLRDALPIWRGGAAAVPGIDRRPLGEIAAKEDPAAERDGRRDVADAKATAPLSPGDIVTAAQQAFADGDRPPSLVERLLHRVRPARHAPPLDRAIGAGNRRPKRGCVPELGRGVWGD